MCTRGSPGRRGGSRCGPGERARSHNAPCLGTRLVVGRIPRAYCTRSPSTWLLQHSARDERRSGPCGGRLTATRYVQTLIRCVSIGRGTQNYTVLVAPSTHIHESLQHSLLLRPQASWQRNSTHEIVRKTARRLKQHLRSQRAATDLHRSGGE